MKKIFALTGVLMLAGVALSGCQEITTDPKIQVPTEFKLNTPPMVNYLYDLAGNHESTIDLSVSQADYGVATFPVYSVQVSLNGAFNKLFETETGTGDYYELYGQFMQANIQVPAEMFCVGVTALQGYKDEEERDTYVDKTLPVFVRVVSRVPGFEAGEIASNVVKLEKVRPFFALRQPGVIYLIGEPQGWKVDEGTWPLYENKDAIGSKIYHAEFDAPEGTFGPFRFYTALGDWEANSVGTQVDDSPIVFDYDIAFEDGVFSYEAVAGKGSWTFENWPGGKIKITVDLNDMNVEFVHLD